MTVGSRGSSNIGTPAIPPTIESSSIDVDDFVVFYDDDLDVYRKISYNNFLNGLTGALVPKGTWNADTNTPDLTQAGTQVDGHLYIVDTAGVSTLSGISAWAVGDTVFWANNKWNKVVSNISVMSVNSRTGAVSGLAEDNNVVHQTGDELNISGHKAFITSIEASKMLGNTTDSSGNKYLIYGGDWKYQKRVHLLNAAGADSATAGAVNADIVSINGGAAGTGVRIRPMGTGQSAQINNKSATGKFVYPPTGQAFNTGGATMAVDAGIELKAGEWLLVTVDGNNYNAVVIRSTQTMPDIYTGVVALSSAEILNLHTTEKLLVAAPGAGKYIEVLSVFVEYKHVTTTYGGGGNLRVGHGLGYGAYRKISNAFWLSQNVIHQEDPGSGVGGVGFTNQPIQLYSNGPITGGDGTAVVHFTYRIITL